MHLEMLIAWERCDRVNMLGQSKDCPNFCLQIEEMTVTQRHPQFQENGKNRIYTNEKVSRLPKSSYWQDEKKSAIIKKIKHIRRKNRRICFFMDEYGYFHPNRRLHSEPE